MLVSVQSALLGISYLRNGNLQGLRIIYGLFSATLYGIILRRVRGRDLAERILSIVFVRISSQISDYKENTCFLSWLLKLVREECSSYMIDDNGDKPGLEVGPEYPILNHILNKGNSTSKTASLLCISKEVLGKRLRSELKKFRG